MKEKKFTNLKSQDCHVLMTQLLPVVLRGILPENVRLAIVKLCAFLNEISQKAIDPEKLIQLQNDVVQCLVSFEMVFPPSFFNITVFLISAITISGVRLYAITIRLIRKMPLQFKVSPSHTIFYVSVGTGPTRRRTHTVGRPLWTHLPLRSRV